MQTTWHIIDLSIFKSVLKQKGGASMYIETGLLAVIILSVCTSHEKIFSFLPKREFYTKKLNEYCETVNLSF